VISYSKQVLTNFIISQTGLRVGSFSDIVVIPDRLLPDFEETTDGNVFKAPPILRELILKRC
jgi:hypothetical protein